MIRSQIINLVVTVLLFAFNYTLIGNTQHLKSCYIAQQNRQNQHTDTIGTIKNSTVFYYKDSSANHWYRGVLNKQTKSFKSFKMPDNFEQLYKMKDSLDEVIRIWKDSSLTNENIIKVCIRLGINHVDMVLQQVLLETGNLQSSLCKNNNNLKGMKYPGQRFSYVLMEKNDYAYYESWVHSLADYKLWQMMVPQRKNETYGQYLGRRKYAEDKNYGARLTTMAKKSFKQYSQLFSDEMSRK